jgi:hypothetical protein
VKRHRSIRKVVMGFIVLGCLGALIGCSGSDGDGSGDTSSTSTSTTSTIQGNVAQVTTAMAPVEGQETRFAFLKDFLTLVPEAHAEDSGLGNITITAMLNGTQLDTTTTDGSGNFVLQVTDGTVTLMFMIGDSKLTVDLFVPPDATVTLGVSLNQPEDEVEVQQLAYNLHDPISCTNQRDAEAFSIPAGDEVVIQGAEGACISVAGDCSLEISATTIELVGCEECVRTRGSGTVALTANDKIDCEASSTGLSVLGNSRVEMTALHSDDMPSSEETVGEQSTAEATDAEATDTEATDTETEREDDAEGEVKINAPTAIDLGGTGQITIMANTINMSNEPDEEAVATAVTTGPDTLVEVKGNGTLLMQAMVLEVSHEIVEVDTTAVDGEAVDGEAESGVIQLSSSGLGVMVQGSGDTTLWADVKVNIESSGDTGVDVEGSASVEIAAGNDLMPSLAASEGDGGDVVITDVAAKGSSNVMVTANGECLPGEVSDESTGTVSVCDPPDAQ